MERANGGKLQDCRTELRSPSACLAHKALRTVECTMACYNAALHRSAATASLLSQMSLSLQGALDLELEKNVRLSLSEEAISTLCNAGVGLEHGGPPPRDAARASGSLSLPLLSVPSYFGTAVDALIREWDPLALLAAPSSAQHEEQVGKQSSAGLMSHPLWWSMRRAAHAVRSQSAIICDKTLWVTRRVARLTRWIQSKEEAFYNTLRLAAVASRFEVAVLTAFHEYSQRVLQEAIQQRKVAGAGVTLSPLQEAAPGPSRPVVDFQRFVEEAFGLSPEQRKAEEVCVIRLQHQRHKLLEIMRQHGPPHFFFSPDAFRRRKLSRVILSHLPVAPAPAS